MNLKTREQTIHDMCLTMRSDYGTELPKNRMFGYGMTKTARSFLHSDMSQLYDLYIAPLQKIIEDTLSRKPQTMSDNKIIISKENPYLAVYQSDTQLCFELILIKTELGEPFKLFLDKKILPDLVDALIELQNSEENK